MLHTTFGLLHRHKACAAGYKKLAKALGGVKVYGQDKPIPLTTILDSNGLSDTLWCLRATLPEVDVARDKLARLLACDYAERALNREREQGREPDPRSWDAIRVSRAYANGETTQEELVAAGDAAGAGVGAAGWIAAWAAGADWVAWAPPAAWAAAGVAGEGARGGEQEWQARRFREYLEGSA
mgnify:CR=1 FL=1